MNAPVAPPRLGLAARPRRARAFAPFEWMLSLRYLRARRQEGFISVIAGFSFLGITLGVATLIVVISVMNGFRKELAGKILGINGHIYVQAYDSAFTDFPAVAERIARVPGVISAIPMIEGQVLARTPVANTFALVHGVREADMSRIPAITRNLKQGTLEGFDDPTNIGISIGVRMSSTLGALVGDPITLINPAGASTPFGPNLVRKAYPVSSVFQIGMSEFDQSFIYMPLAEAQAFFNRPDEVTVIEVHVQDPDNLGEMRRLIEQAAERPVSIADWQQRNRTFFGALAVERNVMFIILTLIVVVAAFNIISGLIMLVKDKGRDIAILRTMGATSGSVLRVFLITGATIGVVGTLSGCVLGTVFALNLETIRNTLFPTTFPAELYFLSQLPVEVRPLEVFSIALLSLALSLLATIYPAWRAARLDPVEALRYG